METAMSANYVMRAFLEASKHGVQQMEHALQGMVEVRDRAEALDRVYRAAHAIGGRAAELGFDQLACFVLVIETMLDRIRRGELEADRGVVNQFLKGCAHLSALLHQAAACIAAAEATRSQLREFTREFGALATVQACLLKAQQESRG